ncbi:DUF4177 domain-containing protein [Ruminococcus sp. CLA-AA-H200]|uniref:DUF4177 domain-containing protein n=1 Tax=Ruminococcus turbiniformis TaxID=2881258 RepID=A0ABS8G280_9FIRM|nr:DUF4177 domain-containing protein [Ruminococcus turbiniformis]MCC2255949.1 DUF4177 domain-containing protein [Ruminococcus turbiniformis]
MYGNSFWDTVSGQQLAANINKLVEKACRKTVQKTFRFDTATDMVNAILLMVEDGWRYVGTIDMSKDAAHARRTGENPHLASYLLIMEREE